MQINRIQNDTSYKGRIQYGYLMESAIKDVHYSELRSEFFNTLKAIKNDGTDNVLTIDFIQDKKYEYIIKYGKFTKKTLKETFSNFDGYYGIISAIVKIGKRLYGKDVISAQPKEFESADKAWKAAEELEKIAQQKIRVAAKEYENIFETLING